MKLRYLLFLVVVLTSFTVHSQTWKLIPNPDTTSEGFSGHSAQLMNGKLYSGYKNSSGKYQLAKFDGKKTTIYNNPDTGSMNNYFDFVTLNNNLFFEYQSSASGIISIAKFDGKKVSVIPLPHYISSGNGNNYFTFKNNLYAVLYNDSSYESYLARYDSISNSFIFFNNPIGSINNSYGFTGGINLFNNNIFFSQTDNTGAHLAMFDGNNINLINFPNSNAGLSFEFSNFANYNNNLLFTVLEYGVGIHIYKYDGNNVTMIPDNPDTSLNLNNIQFFTVYNNNLYFNYMNTANTISWLGMYDGIKTYVLKNPDNGSGLITSYSVANYNNLLYCTYTKENSKNYLAKYNGSKLTIINNPDTLSQGITSCDTFNNHLYLGYYGDGINIKKLYYGRYNDTGIVIFKYPDSGNVASFLTSFNNALYAGYQNTKGMFQLAFIDSGLAVTPVNAVKGKTITSTGKTIKNCVINFKGDGAGSDNTDSTGFFTLGLSNGNYTILPTKNNDINKTNGVTAIDIALTQSHILGKTKLNSPYKLIAADVNGDGKVTALDIVYMKRLILGLDTTFTNNTTKENRLWAFVDSSYKFADSTNPFPFKDSISYTNLNANQINQTFIGIKLGDVNWDWNPALARMKSPVFVKPKSWSIHNK